MQFLPLPIITVSSYLCRRAHPKTSKPANTKKTTSGAPILDKLDWTFPSAVAVALGLGMINAWVDVGGTGVRVLVGVMLG